MASKIVRSIRVDAQVWAILKKLADKETRSISYYVARLLTEHAEKAKP